MLVFGYDPGGSGSNGLASICNGAAELTTVDTVAEAVDWFAKQSAVTGERPLGIGIDALLSWSAGSAGWRPMDRWLQATYPAVKGSVMAPNSLYGSMALGGMALALLLRRLWPQIVLNETHPVVLYFARLSKRRSFDAESTDWLLDHAQVTGTIGGEHEWDALLSAQVTRDALVDGAGHRDLMDLDGTDALLFPAGPVRYWWPTTGPQDDSAIDTAGPRSKAT